MKTAQLAYEARSQPHPRRKLIWEAYSRTRLLGEQAERLGAQQWLGLLKLGTSQASSGTCPINQVRLFGAK